MAIPYPDISPYASNRIYYAGGEATIDRYAASSVGGALGASNIMLTGFTALHTETCTQITSYTTATAAGATPTLCRMCVYSVDPNTGIIFLQAATANDPTLWSAPNTRWVSPLTTPFNKVANSFYMLGMIIVTAAAVPTMVWAGSSGVAMFTAASSAIPPVTGRVVGQSDLPTAIARANYNLAYAPFFMEVLP